MNYNIQVIEGHITATLSDRNGNFADQFNAFFTGMTTRDAYLLTNGSKCYSSDSNGYIADLVGYRSSDVVGAKDAIEADDTLVVIVNNDTLINFNSQSNKQIWFNFEGIDQRLLTDVQDLYREWEVKLFETTKGKIYNLSGLSNAGLSWDKDTMICKFKLARIRRVFIGSKSGGVYTGMLYRLSLPSSGNNMITYNLVSEYDMTDTNNATVPTPMILNHATDGLYMLNIYTGIFNINMADLTEKIVNESTTQVKQAVGSTYVSR